MCVLVQVRKVREGACPTKIFQKYTLQNVRKHHYAEEDKNCDPMGGLLRYHMSTVLQKIDFQGFPRVSTFTKSIFQEVNCIPGVSRSNGYPVESFLTNNFV